MKAEARRPTAPVLTHFIKTCCKHSHVARADGRCAVGTSSEQCDKPCILLKHMLRRQITENLLQNIQGHQETSQLLMPAGNPALQPESCAGKHWWSLHAHNRYKQQEISSICGSSKVLSFSGGMEGHHLSTRLFSLRREFELLLSATLVQHRIS